MRKSTQKLFFIDNWRDWFLVDDFNLRHLFHRIHYFTLFCLDFPYLTKAALTYRIKDTKHSLWHLAYFFGRRPYFDWRSSFWGRAIFRGRVAKIASFSDDDWVILHEDVIFLSSFGERPLENWALFTFGFSHFHWDIISRLTKAYIETRGFWKILGDFSSPANPKLPPLRWSCILVGLLLLSSV